MQAFDDLITVQERGRYLDRAVRAGRGEQFAVAQERLDTADGDAETSGDIWQRKPVTHEGVVRGVDLGHESNLPRAGHCETPPCGSFRDASPLELPEPLGKPGIRLPPWTLGIVEIRVLRIRWV